MKGSDTRYRKGDETYSISTPSRSNLFTKDAMAFTKSALLLLLAILTEKNRDPVAPPIEIIAEAPYKVNNSRDGFVLSKFKDHAYNCPCTLNDLRQHRRTFWIERDHRRVICCDSAKKVFKSAISDGIKERELTQRQILLYLNYRES